MGGGLVWRIICLKNDQITENAAERCFCSLGTSPLAVIIVIISKGLSQHSDIKVEMELNFKQRFIWFFVLRHLEILQRSALFVRLAALIMLCQSKWERKYCIVTLSFGELNNASLSTLHFVISEAQCWDLNN